MTKQEIRAEWVRMLRSGDFEQGKNLLRNKNDQFCCLGVLCELAVTHGVIGPAVFDREFGKYKYDQESQILPAEVRSWVGLESNTGEFEIPEPENGRAHHEQANCLSGRNDRGATFEQIANLIESAPNGLFVEETT